MAKAQKTEIRAEYVERLYGAAVATESAAREGREVGITQLGRVLHERHAEPGKVTVAAALKAIETLAAKHGMKFPGLSTGNCSKYETIYRAYIADGDVTESEVAQVSIRALFAGYRAFLMDGAPKPMEASDVVTGLINGTLEIPKPEKKESGMTLLKVTVDTAARVKEYGPDVNGTINDLLEVKDAGLDTNTEQALQLLIKTSDTKNSTEFLQWAKKQAAKARIKAKKAA